MLKVYAHEFVHLGKQMADLDTLMYLDEGDGKELSAEDAQETKDALTQHFKKLDKTCEALDLATSLEMIRHALKDLPQTRRELRQLLRVVEKELKGQLFFHIPSDRARYYIPYDPAKPPLIPAFPKASKELARAHNCYAFGEYTAGVFHAMRAAEIALKAVAPHLNVTFNKPLESLEWKTLIEMIDAHVRTLAGAPRTSTRDEDLQFYGDAASQFMNFKEAFRKHVAHARETYDEIPCISVLHRTREFLEVLSKRISEPA